MDERPTSPATQDRSVNTSLHLSNGPSLRRSLSSRPNSTSPPDGSILSPHQYSFHQISTLTVVKDSKGYGMKVSGNNPVFVQSVKEGGAAEKAGLHSGDKIIKVNGTDVTHSTHNEVVDLIKSSTEVLLTVQQRIPSTRPPPSALTPSTCTTNRCSSPMSRQSSPNPVTPTNMNTISNIQRPLPQYPSSDRITAPQPVDHEKKKQLESQREQTFRLMLEKEQRYVEALRSELAKCDSTNEQKIKRDLMKAERRVCTLQEQLNAITSNNNFNTLPSSANNGLIDIQLVSNPPPPPPLSTLPSRLNIAHAFHPSADFNHLSNSTDIAPPLPSRNRNLTSPVLVKSPQSTSPPPLPPKPYPHSPISYIEGNQDSNVNMAISTDLSSPSSPLPIHHQRTKSNPDTVNNNNTSMSLPTEENISGSLCDLRAMKKSKGGVAWNVVDSPFTCTPPGTPPPPYCGTPRHHTDNSSQCSPRPDEVDDIDKEDISSRGPVMSTDLSSPNATIISMEDDDMSDQEMSQLGDLGPFKSVAALWEHNIHLAVFLNFVLSNCDDTSSILFYLLTDLYKEGNVKEMRRWAYEIHSSFLGRDAPLKLNNVDDTSANRINKVLLTDYDKEEELRKVFLKPRAKAKDVLNKQLKEFQDKKKAGLGTMYGPTDAVLDECIHDKSNEQYLIKHHVLPMLKTFMEEVDKQPIDDKKYTTAIALETILSKMFGIRVLEKCSPFVSKEKSFKDRLKRKEKVTFRGHHFVEHQYFSVTYCRHCQDMIRGIGPQGFQCSNCCINIHRHCYEVIEENCPGPVPKKERGNDRISKFMDKIRPERAETRRKPSLLQFEKRKQIEDREEGSLTDNESADKSSGSKGRTSCTNSVGDSVRESSEKQLNKQFLDAERGDGIFSRDLISAHNLSQRCKSSCTSINRSESYKERIHQKRPIRDKRKTSDPNLSKTNSNVEIDSNTQYPYTCTNSGSSSNSNLSSRSIDSPNNSLEVVGSSYKGIGENSRVSLPSTFSNCSANDASFWDSDLEPEVDPPDVSIAVPPDVLNSLSKQERKRQEVINELCHTEKSHVHWLKVLEVLFYCPLREQMMLSEDYLQLLFPNLKQMSTIHSQFRSLMNARRKENPVVGEIGDILVKTFDGNEGDTLETAAVTFCRRQKFALERLKELRIKKDLHHFLQKAECNPHCRRLQLQDIIPTELQRLTKYPLLFENLAESTRNNKVEEERIRTALRRSKEILERVNDAVKEAADLGEILRKLDYDKSEASLIDEFKKLDIWNRKIIDHGCLNLKIFKNKFIEVYALLLEKVIILFQKTHEKYLLQNFTITVANSFESASPIIKSMMIRNNARDHRELYLIDTPPNGRKIGYTLVAANIEEGDKWLDRISAAADAHKKDGKQKTAALSVHDLDHCANGSESPVKTKENDGSHSSSDTPVTPAGSARQSQDDGHGNESAAKKSGSGGAPSTSPGGLRKKRIPAAEPPRFTTEVPLIEPSQVLVSQQAVLTAEPVLTPLEKVRRNYETINDLLCENNKLVSNMLHVSKEDSEALRDACTGPAYDKEATELVRSAINEVDQLTTLLNECLRFTEEDVLAANCEVNLAGSGATTVCKSSGRSATNSARTYPSIPASKVRPITQALRSHHTVLLAKWTEREEERERQRLELQRSREQLHAMHEMQQRVQRINDQTPPSNESVQNPGKVNKAAEESGSPNT